MYFYTLFSYKPIFYISMFLSIGMLEFLTSDCPQAQLLRQVFVIFIAPMLNPDGVIYGECCMCCFLFIVYMNCRDSALFFNLTMVIMIANISNTEESYLYFM